MDETKYLEAIQLIFNLYSGDFDKISHLIRVSTNLNLTTFDERIAAILYPTIKENKLTFQDIETQFNTWIADIVNRIMPYSDEDEYVYIDRINADETLSKLYFCIQFDLYYIETYKSRQSIKNLADIKYNINQNAYAGFGLLKC